MGTVVTYAVAPGFTDHEVAARVAVARSLAALKGFKFGGGYDAALQHGQPLYFVPSETLSGEEATRLGIRGADDDVLLGRDARRRWHCGVLEQSWRIGGASGPEVAYGADAKYTMVERHGIAH